MYGEERTDALIESFEEAFGHKPPTSKQVCPTCGGEGEHANPALRDHGFTQSEIYEMGIDEFNEFQADYRRGVYNQRCLECKGLRVVDQIDIDQLGETERKYVEDWYNDAAESAAISRMEQGWGY